MVAEYRMPPQSSLDVRLLDIRDDPVVHLLPTKTIPHDTFLRAALLGFVPQPEPGAEPGAAVEVTVNDDGKGYNENEVKAQAAIWR